jgi:[ribosomal protein S5]-alanine N-acetyltransferase
MLDICFEMQTNRLILRPLRASDYDVWKETFLNLPKAKNRWDMGPRDKKELSKLKFKKVLSTQKKHRDQDILYDLVAFDRKTDAMVGFAALTDISRGVFQNAYLGYSVLSPKWGAGYGKEMVKATLEIAFKVLKIHRVEAGIEPDNKPSIALAKSLKMRREGLSKRRLFLSNQWQDIVIYAMTAEEMGIEGLSGRLMQNRR